MKLLKRNTVPFEYRAYLGQVEVLKDGLHTGNYVPNYGVPMQYYGNISAPSGVAQAYLFGLDTQYTHVLLMDDMDADINVDGVITRKGVVYDVVAVRPSLNVQAIALSRRTVNNVE